MDLALPLNLQEQNEAVIQDGAETCRINSVECTLVWRDLEYHIIQERFLFHKQLARVFPFIPPVTGRCILQSVSGYAEPGKFLGVIGSSGAGKTSLLNILANNVASGEIGGTVEANGTSIRTTRTIRKYKKIVGYVLQQDSLLPFLTVKETMFYAGMLTLPRSMNFLQKLERIDSLVFELGLDKCVDSLVGNNIIRGISGGELKRLSIGIELLRDPSILLLDEPTSGLDARSALHLCQNLGRLAKKFNHTIIAVIHQPRALIFQQLDDLLIMAPGGRQIYFGRAANAMGYFSARGFQCPALENPADYFIDQTTVDFSNYRSRIESEERISSLADKWNQHPEPECINDSGIENTISEKRASLFWQTFWVTCRESSNESRNARYIFTRFVQCFAVAFLLGILLLRMDNDQASITERTGTCFFAIMTISFNEMMAAMAVFIAQRDVFFRERKARLYHPTAYWIGKQLALLPYQLFYPGIWIVLIYWLSGFQVSWYRFGIFFAVLQGVAFFCNSWGLLLGASLPPAISTVFGPVFILVSCMTAGFLIHLDNMTVPFYWLSFLSYARWAYEALVKNEFHDLTFTCSSAEIADSTCRFRSGKDYIDTLEFSELNSITYIMILLVAIIILRISLWFVLRFSRSDA